MECDILNHETANQPSAEATPTRSLAGVRKGGFNCRQYNLVSICGLSFEKFLNTSFDGSG